MVRATPTGVSAVIDAYGRPVASLPEGALGVIDRRLPAALPPTPFSCFGNAPFALMIAGSLAIALGLRRRP
jgi:apolipoprotein N-acyltransferase